MEQQVLSSKGGVTKRNRVVSRRIIIAAVCVLAFFAAFAVFNFFRFNGPAGFITEIGDSFVIVEDRPGIHWVRVVIGDKTLVRSGRDIIGSELLKVGDFILILGGPRNGVIEAKEIVVLEDHPPVEFLKEKKK